MIGWRRRSRSARGEEAADLGTALHAMAHRLETEPGFKAPAPHDADLAAYLMAIDQAGLESTHCEVHVCADGWRAAGTPDRIYRAVAENLRFPTGRWPHRGRRSSVISKPGNASTTPSRVTASSSRSTPTDCFYDVDTDERSPFPDGLHTGWGILVHLPAGQADCHLVVG